jgi:hypothetical protein
MPPREQGYCRGDRQGADEHRGAYPANGGKSTAGERGHISIMSRSWTR